MKLAYLLTVILNRIVGLLSLLILSHTINGELFGSYSLLYLNALLIQTIFGSWLAMATTWSLSTNTVSNHSFEIYRIKLIASYIITFECVIYIIYVIIMFFLDLKIDFEQATSLLFFVIVTLIFDIFIATKNALGDDAEFLKISLIRNIVGNALATIIGLLGGNASLIMFGQTLGIALCIIISVKTKSLYKLMFKNQKNKFSIHYFLTMLRFGFTGSLALGTTVLVNNLIRNSVLISNGKADAGVYSLIGDLFIAPLILFGSSYSLSKMRYLYQAQHFDVADKLNAYKQFFATIIFISAPYAVGGFFLAPSITKFIVPSSMQSLAVMIAGPLVIQSAALTVTMTSITLLLTSGRKKRTLFLVSSTLSIFLTAGVLGNIFKEYGIMAWFMAVASAIALIVSIFAIGLKAIPWKSLMKSTVAASVMGIVIVYATVNTSLTSVAFSLFAGISTYAFVAVILRPIEWDELLPTRNG